VPRQVIKEHRDAEDREILSQSDANAVFGYNQGEPALQIREAALHGTLWPDRKRRFSCAGHRVTQTKFRSASANYREPFRTSGVAVRANHERAIPASLDIRIGGLTMATAYYSTVLDHTIDEVWSMIRDFNSYPNWVDGIDESHIEDGRTGDAVGSVRTFVYEGSRMRQRLLAMSDVDHTLTFEMCEPHSLPVRNFVSTLRVSPVVDGDRAFIEWWATLDCPAEAFEYWTSAFPREDGFAKWLESLRVRLSNRSGYVPE
jgi:polyketide cyclase/dehydrase/lipid transport protein